MRTTTERVSSLRLLASNPVTVVSALVLAAVVFVAVAAAWIAPFGVNDIDVPNALRPPGGDQNDQDPDRMARDKTHAHHCALAVRGCRYSLWRSHRLAAAGRCRVRYARAERRPRGRAAR